MTMTSLYNTAHNQANRWPKNTDVTFPFYEEKVPTLHGYDQHTGRLNTNEAINSTFH